MANQNLFDKYGIKEVADVTFYRIEKKEETYESQRNISIASILKGAVEKMTVYPMVNGVGSENGFEAYVFTNADLITGINYDCDDDLTVRATFVGKIATKTKKATLTQTGRPTVIYNIVKTNGTISSFVADGDDIVQWDLGYPLIVDTKNNRTLSDPAGLQIKDGEGSAAFPDVTITYSNETEITGEDSGDVIGYTYSFTVSFPIAKYSVDGGGVGDLPDDTKIPGTHEFTYAEQVFLQFAHRQNLITKNGARYRFLNADNLLGSLMFEDLYSATPSSTEQVVVLGLTGVQEDGVASWSEDTYEIDEIDKAISQLTQSFQAKAYDVVYNSYAELSVEDEMGFYNEKFLGSAYDQTSETVSFFNTLADYETWARAKNGVDTVLAQTTMWENDTHYSINDAIEALRQQQKIIDATNTEGVTSIASLYGGYKVGNNLGSIPVPGQEDTAGLYTYSASGSVIANIDSLYNLNSVNEALAKLNVNTDAIAKAVRVNTATPASNRAIYVRNTAVDSGKAYIYLLHNKNYRKLSQDQEGVFTFEDKKGNKLFYQDKIFKKVEWLALVVNNNKGMIFVVNRHGNKNIDRIAWMINENGYISDSRAAALVENGLIHTTDITVNDETFEATCEVYSMKIRKIVKKVNHYTPVLFLDTLKVSTIEQTAEEVYATGGKGNSNLIGWDYGREITLSLQDALYTPGSLAATFGGYDGNDFRNGVKDVKTIDRMEKVTAKRSFIVPAGNQNGTPTEADKGAYAVFYDPTTMEPYADGTPIAEGETFLKFTRSVAYEGQSIGKAIEISADKFPGTYRIVGDTYVRSKETGEDERFQFVVPLAKMQSEQTITLEADGDPSVNSIILSNALVKIA